MDTRRCTRRNLTGTDGDVAMNQKIELSKRVKKVCLDMGHNMDRFKKINQMTISATCKTCGANVWITQKSSITQKSDNSYEFTGPAMYEECTNEKQKDLKVGDRVAYLPVSANALMRKDVEYGTITSMKDDIIFVRFQHNESSQGCKRKQLRKM